MIQVATKLLLPVALTGALLGGCKGKDGDPGPAGTNGTNGAPGPQGPAGPNLRGNVVGFVTPVDEFGSLLVSRAGVTVSLDGATPAVTAVTNADGRFELTNVATGTYNLTYSRGDVNSSRRIGFQHAGGDQPTYLGFTSLTQSSSTRITNVTASLPTAAGTNLSFTATNSLSPFSSNLRYLIFVGTNSNVSTSTGIWYGNTSGFTSPNSPFNNFTLTKSVLNAAGFASGATAFAVMYGAPSNLPSYLDVATGRNIPIGLNSTPSNVVSFIVP